MTRSRKLAATAALFVLALITVVISAASHSGIPLFFGWLPLIAVGWVLTRPEPSSGEESPPASDEG